MEPFTESRARWPGEPSRMTLKGAGAAPGLARGNAYLHRDILEIEPRRANGPGWHLDTDGELKRVDAAFARVRGDLLLSARRAEKKIGRELAEIFEAQEAMLQDALLQEEIRRKIEESIRTDVAVRQVFRWWEQRFHDLDDPYLRERADDVADLARRVLRSLAGVERHSLERLPRGSVLVARRVMPSEIVQLQPDRVRAILVEEGGTRSHCALLARGLGIPKVVQVEGLLSAIRGGEPVLVDGEEGLVVLSPSKEVERGFRRRLNDSRLSAKVARREAQRPAVIADGREIEVLANITGRVDAEAAVEHGADGVGLFRVESIYLRAAVLPSEEDLFESIAETLEPFEGRPVTVRLLDAGGDKVVPCLNLSLEADPYLGRRGVRLLFDYPKLLSSQLRALIRLAGEFDLRILIPMVTDLSDVVEVRSALRQCIADLGVPSCPPLGAMIETPAAALFAEEICSEVDFVSIGTNDLTQYVMAAARGNPLVSRYYQEKHPAVMKMVRLACEGAAAAGKPVSVCGALAAWEDCVPLLVEAGVTSLSVAPPLIPGVKSAVRKIG